MGNTEELDAYSEVTRYLDSPPDEAFRCSKAKMTGEDIATYWKGKMYEYPGLSHMALDYLSIPATSTCSEQAFSAAKLMVTDLR